MSQFEQQQEHSNITQRAEQVWDFFYRARRRVATAGVGLLAMWLAFHVIFGANGMVVYQNKRVQYHKLQKDLLVEEEENQRLAKQVDQLKTNPKAIEREAREQLGYARPGEVIYVSPESKKADHHSTEAVNTNPKQ
jgi:cell division protein FtsB